MKYTSGNRIKREFPIEWTKEKKMDRSWLFYKEKGREVKGKRGKRTTNDL